MIISKKHKFIFVKGRKVASTSVEVFLSSICSSEDIITPITPIDEKFRIIENGRALQNYGADPILLSNYINAIKSADHNTISSLSPPDGCYYNHMPFKEIEKKFGVIDDTWKVFGIERSPYNKIISFANMQLNFEDYQKSGRRMRSSINELRSQIDKIFESGCYMRVRNIELYKDFSGVLRVQLLRFENLIMELDSLMNELNISKVGILKHFKRGLSSESIPLETLFTREQLDLVNTSFIEEFESFGYRMI